MPIPSSAFMLRAISPAILSRLAASLPLRFYRLILTNPFDHERDLAFSGKLLLARDRRQTIAIHLLENLGQLPAYRVTPGTEHLSRYYQEVVDPMGRLEQNQGERGTGKRAELLPDVLRFAA